MNLSLKKNPKDPANIGDIIEAFRTIPIDKFTSDKIIYGKPNERPLPFKLKGYLFVDYATPAGYLSIGTSWVNFTGSNSSIGNVDGGNALSVYLLNQELNGGGA